MSFALLHEYYIGSVIFDAHRPGGITSEDSHRLACLVIRESILQQLVPVHVVNNNLLNNLATLLQQWFFWFPFSEWYVQGGH